MICAIIVLKKNLNRELEDNINKMKRLKKYLRVLRGAIVLVLFKRASEECRSRICEDIEIYSRKNVDKRDLLILFFDESQKSFRNVFYYRIEWDRRQRRLLNIVRKIFKPCATIEIWGDIDGGLKIAHNYCVINVKKCGKHLNVMQGVTIGAYNGSPVIGDDVMVFANATVFGPITIGNTAVIGAGAVVNKDVPEKAVVAGNPFKILSYEKKF